MQHLSDIQNLEQEGLWKQYDLEIVDLITTEYYNHGDLFAYILSAPSYYILTLHNALCIMH